MTDIESIILDEFTKYCNALDEDCPVILLDALALLNEKLNQEGTN